MDRTHWSASRIIAVILLVISILICLFGLLLLIGGSQLAHTQPTSGEDATPLFGYLLYFLAAGLLIIGGVLTALFTWLYKHVTHRLKLNQICPSKPIISIASQAETASTIDLKDDATRNKPIEYGVNSVITLSSFVILFTVLSRLFAPQGSFLQQGYIGPQGQINLSNISLVALALLLLSTLASKLFINNATGYSENVRKLGFALLALTAILFVILIILIMYAVQSGHLFDGYQF